MVRKKGVIKQVASTGSQAPSKRRCRIMIQADLRYSAICNHKTGWKTGDWVSFAVDTNGLVSNVKPIPRPKSKHGSVR